MQEGREYSSTGNVHPKPNSSDDEDEYEDLINDTSHDHDHNETYVIQVPKDQIYRVPPPENAIFAEQKRTAVPQTKSMFSVNCILLSALILLLVIAFITGICLAVADKADPTFRVHRMHVATKGKGNRKQHEFDFTLRSKNANNHAVILFEKGGKASLSYRDYKPLAKGEFPTSKQDTDSSEYTKLKLVSGSGKTFPKVIQKSMNGTSHTAIKLLLGFNVPLRFKVGVFPVKSKILSIACNVKVKRLINRVRILSQDCDYSTS
ncbi:NDR1/HIN1-like protein 13 [Bidens hawaiensis]|uniref:NDR1/HIN1-like protein 13 n=1 Tax=Bidens hawaiensis TaxID=980011 RepID=UPI0040499647